MPNPVRASLSPSLFIHKASAAHRRHPASGAAALEYILVSTFAAVVTIGALGFIGKIVKDQLTNMGTRLGVAEEPDLVDPFTGGD